MQAREVALRVGEAGLVQRPVMVPMASKKFVNTSVKTSTMGGEHADAIEAAEAIELADEAEVGKAEAARAAAGTVRLQPPGFSAPAGPTWKTPRR